MAEEKSKYAPIFTEVRYFIPSECSEEVKQILKQEGAKKEFYISDLVTHVISDTCDEALRSEVQEYSLPIVNQRWVTMSMKVGMKLPTKPFSPLNDGLFSGLIICPSQISQVDLDKLWAMVSYHGGICQLNLTPTCTHLIVPKACGIKYETATKSEGRIKIVTPSWVADCIKNDKRLDEGAYLPSKDVSTIDKPQNEGDSEDPLVTITPPSKTSPHSKPSKVVKPFSNAFLSPDTAERVTIETDDRVEVRETPVKTKGQSSHQLTMEENMVLRCEPCADKVTTQGTAEHVEIMTQNAQSIEINQDPKFIEQELQNSGQASLLGGCVFAVSDYQDNMDPSILHTWIEVIKSNGGQVEPFYSNRCTHLLCLNKCGKFYPKALEDGKKIVTAHWLNDVLTDKRMMRPSNPLHFPVPFPYKMPECKSLSISVTGYTGIERQLVKNMIFVVGAGYTGYLTRSNTHVICKSCEGDKYAKAREWGIPCVNGNWIGDIVSSGNVPPCNLKRYALFGEDDDLSLNLEYVKQLLDPWKNDPVPLTNTSKNKNENGKKRKHNVVEHSSVEEVQNKKRRFSDSSTVEKNGNIPRVLFTGLSMGKVSTLMKMLTELGGVPADSHRTCTHLIATKIIRTVKFLSAISISQFIVTPNWIEESYNKKQFLDPKSFLLKDLQSEKEYNMQLTTSLERAQNNKLLQGIQVYATQNVQPCPSSLKDIVESAGGQFLTSIPSKMMLRSLKNSISKEGKPSLLVVTCQEDLELCDTFIKCGVDIHSTEVILAGVLTQELDFNTYKVKMVS